MLSYYLTDDTGNLHALDRIQKNCWINMIQPTREEVDEISAHLDIPLDFIWDTLDHYERGRVERRGENVLVIIDFPVKSLDRLKIEYFRTIPMGIISLKDYFITVCLKDNHILERFSTQKLANFSTQQKTHFALRIMEEIISVYLKDLIFLQQKNNELEERLNNTIEDDRLEELVSIQKSLVFFSSSLNNVKRISEKMIKVEYLPARPEDHSFLEDLVIEIKQVLEMTDNHSNTLNYMTGIYTSIISNKVNAVMKSLTLFTIILTAPTLVFSFFGMNVYLPFMNISWAWVITLIISAAISGIFAWILIKRH